MNATPGGEVRGQRKGPDLDEVLRSVSLEALLDERCPPPRQRVHHRRWPCPTHSDQTGRTPPVSVRVDEDGCERWRCWSCGDGGTAIDLLMRLDGGDFRSALTALAGDDWAGEGRPRITHRRPPREYLPALPADARDHVIGCRDRLWRDDGAAGRAWLEARGLLDERVLRANGVGYDPGGRHDWRRDGLPRCEGIIFPILDEERRLITYQSRNMRPDADYRWLSPDHTAGPERPALAFVSNDPTPAAPVLVCEGMTDGMAAAIAGFRTWVVLGTSGGADPRLPGELAGAWERSGRPRICLCGDNDGAGHTFSERVQEALGEHGVAAGVITPPQPGHDLHDWFRAAGVDAFRQQVSAQYRGGALGADL